MKYKYIISIIFLLLVLLTLLTSYYGSTDVGDYADVAKYFSGKYSQADIVDAFISKKRGGVITANKEIRQFSKILSAADKGLIEPKEVRSRIDNFLQTIDVSVNEIYAETAESLEQLKTIIKTSIKLRKEIDSLDLRKVPREERDKLRMELDDLMNLIRKKAG